MVQFYERDVKQVEGWQLYEEQLIKQLTRIADNLERLNEEESVVANVNSASSLSHKRYCRRIVTI